MLASMATFIWWFSEPGLLNHLALRVMFICSVSTILFNGNPLLRFDGYYILSDIVEIPNLRQKSSKILQNLASQWCLGLEVPEDPFLPQRNHGFFAIYTIAAVIYRWFVFFSILLFLNKVFEPYGLKVIGQFIALMGIFGLVVMPVWKMGKFFHVPGRMDQVKRPRLYATLSIVTVLILAVVFLPLPRNVRCTVQLRAGDAASIYVKVPGRLDEVLVESGQHVDKGKTLARLTNVSLQLDVEKLEGKQSELEKQLASLRTQGVRDHSVHLQIDTVEQSLESTRKQLKQKRDDLGELHLVAPVAGTVLPPPRRKAEQPADGRLPTWSGSPLETKNLAVELMPSDLFCQIGDPRQLEAILAIDQGDIELVAEDQRAKLNFDAIPGTTYEGTVHDIAESKMDATPQSLTHQAGGGLAARTDQAGIARPLSSTYVARVSIDNSDDLLRVGMRGRAKIRAGYQSLGGRLWRYLARTFHFYL
jgi:putative peptide zinc metalloprotease protein